MAPFFGNSVACRLPRAHEINHSTLVLGDWRAAQRIEFSLNSGEGAHSAAGGSLLSGSGFSRSAVFSSLTGGPAAGRAASSGGKDPSTGGGSGGDGVKSSSAGSGVGSAQQGVLSSGMKFWVVNSHLDHAHADNRQRQVGVSQGEGMGGDEVQILRRIPLCHVAGAARPRC